MKFSAATLIASLSMLFALVEAVAQEPMTKGAWTIHNEKPETVDFEYGTELSAKDIRKLATFKSITEIQFGFPGVDSEYVTIDGDLDKLGRLKNLKVFYLNKDGITDKDLKFIAMLPKIRELEFNAKNGKGGCTDRCGKFLSSAKGLRELRIYNGNFTDKFVDKITNGLPELEELMLSSPELTDKSLQRIAERCKNLKRLAIGSKRFTPQGLKHLEKLSELKERFIHSHSN